MAAVLQNNFSLPIWLTGVIFASLVAFVILGGIQRISDVASKLVPAMIILYLGAGLAIILEISDGAIYSRRAIEKHLGAKVLTTIPKIAFED